MTDSGYLLVSARTADGVLLIPGATVRVYNANGSLLSEQITNRDGYTSEIEIPTPPLALSLSPGPEERPYAQVRILVEKIGFLSTEFLDAPVFPNVVTIQQTNLQATPDYIGTPNWPEKTIINESEAQTL